MRYREIIPQPPLNKYIECFWTLESSAPSTQPERILPDGCIELILNFGDRFSQHCDHTRKLQPKNFLVGQMTGPIMISPSGPIRSISTNPGVASFHSAQVFNAILDLSIDPGRVNEPPLTCN